MRLFRLALLSTAALAAPLHAAPRFSFSGSAVNAGTHAPFVITRTGGTGSTTLTFKTLDAQASSTAKAGLDYVATTQILNFGRTLPKSITVYVSTTARSGVTGSLIFSASITGRYVPLLTATSTIFEAAAPPATQTCPDGSVIPSTSMCPMPTPPPTPTPVPTPSGYVTSPSLAGAAFIDDGANPALALTPSWGTGAIPGTAAPDVVGAFRFICQAGQVLPDDPIVYPGQPGKSHLHQFYGNTAADAFSTYLSLRTAGQSTCNRGVNVPANRSGYWMPAMLNASGVVVKPDFAIIYYKRRPATDPKCSLTSGDAQAEGNCVAIPNAIRFIFGYDFVSNTPATGSAWFNCQGPTAVPGHYANLELALANCPAGAGNQVGAIIEAPECWDGQNLDSPNHRSHVGYPSYGTWGYRKCPAGLPYVIPTFTLGAWYPRTAGAMHLSCDAMLPASPAGTCWHADYWEGWNATVKAEWTTNDIDKLLNASGGDLGDGKQLIGAQ